LRDFVPRLRQSQTVDVNAPFTNPNPRTSNWVKGVAPQRDPRRNLFYGCPLFASTKSNLEETMKRLNALLVGAALVASTAALAQTPPAKSGPNNNAVNSAGQNNSNAPVAGRNSFTEGQAQSAIEKAGYTNVTGLKKDDNGVWRGNASKGGASTSVSVDFQGNVIAAK
jgi:hypothetical protein